MRTASDVYTMYRDLGNAMVERYRQRLCQADPRVGMELAFHLTGNWGNEAARALLYRYREIQSWLYYRGDREYALAEHRTNHQTTFTPAWCRHCHPLSAAQPRGQYERCRFRSDAETELRAIWTAKGVPQERQDALIAQIRAKAQPGAVAGPFAVQR